MLRPNRSFNFVATKSIITGFHGPFSAGARPYNHETTSVLLHFFWISGRNGIICAFQPRLAGKSGQLRLSKEVSSVWKSSSALVTIKVERRQFRSGTAPLLSRQLAIYGHFISLKCARLACCKCQIQQGYPLSQSIFG